MPTLPTTTAAFASSATEAEFKTFLSDFRAFVAYMLGTTGLPDDAKAAIFPSGTAMLFAQAAAPTGWTKQTTHNDKALRVVSGDGGGSGGVQAFSTLFGRTSVDASSLSIDQLAAHTHGMTGDYTTSGAAGLSTPSGHVTLSDKMNTGTRQTTSTGSGYSHAHGLDLRVQYVDVIIATKN